MATSPLVSKCDNDSSQELIQADLDSITSSVVFAYLRSAASASTGRPSVYVPLLNIPSADLRIRPELTALLPYANIEAPHLATLDDLPDEGDREVYMNPDLTSWLLVDHNALPGKLGEVYSHRVVGCIDHHVEENKVSKENNDEPRIITKAGSCTSLVVNHFREAWDSLSNSSSPSNTAQGQSDAAVGTDDEAVRRTWDMQLAKFALASILIDTNNLTSKDKVTDHDQKAARYLEAKINLAPKGALFDRQGFFEELSTAKQSVGSLSLKDILRKDYKQWEENGKQLGVCSIVTSLSNLVSKAEDEGFYTELDAFAKERSLAVLALMTKSSSDNGKFQKELLVRILDRESQPMLKKFEDLASSDLQLQPSDEVQIQNSGVPTKIWWQRDTSKTRKQVAPSLRDALKL